MRIGIDIDDTITNTWESFIPRYFEMFNVPLEKLKKSKPYYSAVRDTVSVEEYLEKVLPILKEETSLVELKPDSKEIINKLYELGYEIIFITARGSSFSKEYGDYIYNKSLEYMDKHGIRYHKLINNAREKAKICVDEKIDLFIDDSVHNCLSVRDENIPVLLFETYYNKDDVELEHVKNWQEIYDYIINK